MAFGITRLELSEWKRQVLQGEIAYLTHYWLDPRFPGITTVTKVGCANLDRLRSWCLENGLNPRYIHERETYPHFDLIGAKQKEILLREGLENQLARFRLL
ncbi:hypothetical protein [Cohnella sp. AR92]|uniref:hypothetical protein n=1 Tax=Cohnella sp. AR92 TaxID=648716 RepID=UPI000F8D9A4B|nr:hypothetical protein [Cohnella sp. AR92]RUS47154.1 hypothetical protein ELR57_12250 [Cohnella sp. AR92]